MASVSIKDIDLGMDRIEKDLRALQRLTLVVKFNNAVYPNGESVKSVAMWNEFGWDEFNVKFPSRPFWRSAFDTHVDSYKNLYHKLFDNLLEGRISPHELMSRMGKYIVLTIQDSIKQGAYEPNSALTVKLKGSSKPLIDTGVLYNSIIWEVV